MKKLILGITAAAALIATPAFSQTTTITTPSAGPSASITLAPEQRTRIKQYVVQQKVKPATVKERIAVGGTLPADVELQMVPNDWGPEVSKYRYVYSDNHVVLVEPSSRRVVQIVE
jgi:hypothetical protein